MKRTIVACIALGVALLAQGAGLERASAQASVNWLMRGDDAEHRGALREALVFFTRSTEQIPEDPAPWYRRAQIYDRLGMNAEALADARHSVAVLPLFDEGFALIARLEQQREAYPAALTAIDRAIALNPRNAAYHERRGEVLRLLGRLNESSDAYAEALRRAPESITAMRGRAEVLLSLHRDREALDILRQYVQRAPNDADANVVTAGLLVKSGRSQDALAWIAAHPSADPRMSDYRVRAYMQLGDRSAATAALPAAAAGDSPYRASLRGQLAFDAGRCREAADAYRVAAADPEAGALAWRNLGAASACAGDQVAAVAALDRAIGLNPTDALAWRYRASANRALRKRDAAITDANEALVLGGPDADLLMLLGIDEYLAGQHADGRRDYARGCALLPPGQTDKRRLCTEQLTKLKPR